MAVSSLCLKNTLTRKKERFRSRKDKPVKMFTCGPSIYSRPHVGNYRTFLYEDILLRYLEYQGYRVERVMNLTDVEDKSIKEARAKGITIEELTDPVAQQFFREAGLLRMKLPSHIPRSSTSVDAAVSLIKSLLKKGLAYWHDKDVFYDPLKFEGFGKLFGLDMSRWPREKRRFRKDTYPGQRWNLGDFILWHGLKGEGDDRFYWETDIGKGRPSWNIQDPAMITQHLGYQIDISCGGVDNLYRHHDYTIAVIEGVSGKTFSRYWLHGEHVLANGAKMSKSKGNIIYPEDMLKKGYSPKHLRFYLIYGHYRNKMNLTEKDFQEKAEKCDALTEAVQTLSIPDLFVVDAEEGTQGLDQKVCRLFEKPMNDDLDVKGALDALHDHLMKWVALKKDGKLSDRNCRGIKRGLEKVDRVLRVIYT
jgi:cysteinyl-tRNA synthetase